MTRSLEEMEESIARERRVLDEWLYLTYAEMEHEKYHPEIDASYENWVGINSVVGSIFDGGLVRRLGRKSIDSMLFFISRNDEIAEIIAWLTGPGVVRFSHCGDLAYDDFLFLAEQALERDEDFCDYQLAISFKKCSSLDERCVDLLNGFFRRNNSYTRRIALHSLAHFRHPSVSELAVDLWSTDSCEFAKLSCLHVLKETHGAEAIFDKLMHEYRAAYDVDAESYRQSHIQALSG